MPKGTKYHMISDVDYCVCNHCGLNYKFKNLDFSNKLMDIHMKKAHGIDASKVSTSHITIVDSTGSAPSIIGQRTMNTHNEIEKQYLIKLYKK